MAFKHSYEITLKNNRTEKEAINLLLNSDPRFIEPDSNGRKEILRKFGLDLKYRRAFDLIMVEGYTNREDTFTLTDQDEITLIEIKSTKKRLENNPYGFFFGATENEFSIAEKLGNNYQFCFVCLHPDTIGYELRTAKELDDLITNKRIQFQINLKNKDKG